MSIKLRLKNTLFSFLEIFPGHIGDFIYHKVQEVFNKKDIDFYLNSTFNTYKTFLDLTNAYDIEITSKNLLEVGSGWHPLMPYWFIYFGKVNKVQTLDINRHYDKRKIEKLNQNFKERYNLNIVEADSRYCLPQEIEYFPDTNILNFDLTNTNIVFTRFALEHIRPEVIEKMHTKFRNELEEGSYIIHFISPSDHRAFVDHNLSLQDFLKYSDEEWEKKCTRFDYHNRLRLPEYLKIFKNCNLKVVGLTYDKYEPNSQAIKRFENIRLDKKYRNYSLEELMAGSINIILKT